MTTTVPEELAGVGDDDTWHRCGNTGDVGSTPFLRRSSDDRRCRQNGFGELDQGAMADALFPDDSPAQNARLCIALAEDDHYTVLGCDVLGDEDGDVILFRRSTEWQPNDLEAKVEQAVFDDVSNGS